eukprot:5872383-Alexandrium_andersonii.AAC.1
MRNDFSGETIDLTHDDDGDEHDLIAPVVQSLDPPDFLAPFEYDEERMEHEAEVIIENASNI